MPLADAYIDSIRKFEGYTPRATWDYKQNSVGYGTRARYPGEVIDRTEAERRLQDELASARNTVRQFAPNLTPGQEAALTSLTFNAGPKWQQSGLGAAVQAGDWTAAKDRFLQYNKAGGSVLPGLASRRQQEAAWIDGTTIRPSGEYAQPLDRGPPRMPLGDASPMPQQPQGNWLDNMTSNPLFLMGAGVLGAPNIGQGIMQGVTASNQMRRQSRQDQQAQELFPLQKQLLEAQAMKAGQPPTSSDITEFQYAKNSGFAGSFMDWMNQKKSAGGSLYGKQGAIFQDADGTFKAIQFGGDGSLKTHPITGADGNPMTPAKGVMQVGDELVDKSTGLATRNVAPQIAGEERAKVSGRSQATAALDLPKAESLHKTITQYIDGVSNDQNLDKMLGYRGYLPNVTPEARTLQSKIDQLNSYGFLQAFEGLKGAGAITEKEGEAATKAYSRLREMVQSGQDYRQALRDFRSEMDRMLDVAKKKAGGGAAPADAKRYRFNPQTGELE